MYIAIDRNDPRSLKGLTSFITRKIRCSLTPSRHKYISLAYNTSDRLPNDADPVTHMLFILNTPPHRKGLFLTQNLNNRRAITSRPFHFPKWTSFHSNGTAFAIFFSTLSLCYKMAQESSFFFSIVSSQITNFKHFRRMLCHF